jgi:hydroxylamine reductase
MVMPVLHSSLFLSFCREPRASYKGRLFTTNSTGWPGVKHIGPDKDFGPVIAAALAAPGFAEGAKAASTSSNKPYGQSTLTGFGHSAVLGAAPVLLDAVSKGNLQRLVLIGGCDGSESERSYYTKLATSLPDQAAILTLGCGKYRVIGKKDYGNIPGTQIPRVIDMGQCNDSYSAVVVALKLAEVLGAKSVNDLPLSIVLSWLEQKAVAVLLSLLHLGVKNIRIGPSLPAFVTPSTLKFLQDQFNLMPIGTDGAADVPSVMGQKTTA